MQERRAWNRGLEREKEESEWNWNEMCYVWAHTFGDTRDANEVAGDFWGCVGSRKATCAWPNGFWTSMCEFHVNSHVKPRGIKYYDIWSYGFLHYVPMLFKWICLCFPFTFFLFLLWPGSVFFSQVALHLRPIQSLRVHQKPLVFVLNSPQSVIWKLQTENLAPGVKRIFHVSLTHKPSITALCASAPCEPPSSLFF